jgi:NAD(P)-dependent dehydrogenase (short-subunit alcohol dehydrogenase family)
MGYFEDRANLRGKVAVVVGGATGVGAAVTLALAKAGVDVAFCDIKAEGVAAIREEVERLGRHVMGSVTDALDPDQMRRFYDEFDGEFERLDIVVNVVGGVQFREFADTTPDQWADDVHRNFGWVLLSTHLAIPRLRVGGGGGSIINFTTVEAHRGAAGLAAYAGAKAGLANFSRALGVELARERIRVNSIAPDTTPSETSMSALDQETWELLGTASREARRGAFAVYVPTGVPPRADELGDAVLFLASDLSSSITGTTIHVDGGTWASAGFARWPSPYGWMPIPPAPLFRDGAFDDPST